MNINEVNEELRSILTLLNNRPVEEFDGRSPTDMFYLINKPYDKGSPLKFRKHADGELLGQIPFIRLVLYYLRLIREQEPVKLTTKGNLPVKLVQTIHEQKILPEKFIESRISKLKKEQDSFFVHTTRIISHLAGLTKKRNNKLTLTSKGHKLLNTGDTFGLFKELFKAFTTRFNWAYHDGFGDNPIGQLGFAFTLDQLIKYGGIERPDTFYGEKYLNAFPSLLEYIIPLSIRTREEGFIRCFSLRTFDHFLKLFGLIELREEGKDPLKSKKFISKTKILDEVIMFE